MSITAFVRFGFLEIKMVPSFSKLVYLIGNVHFLSVSLMSS